MVIAITNQKGGVGKTTLSLHLAGEYARQRRSVKVIDMDPQSSGLSWLVQRDSLEHETLFEMDGYPKENLHRHIEQKSKGYDLVIVDVPPQVRELARSAIIGADLVLIPIRPGPLDVWAANDTVKIVNEAMIYRPELKCAFVVNGYVKGTGILPTTLKALEDHEPHKALRQVVGERIAFKYSLAEGQAIHEYEPSGKAAKEIKVLARQIDALFGDDA